jgi:hypothetical protein
MEGVLVILTNNSITDLRELFYCIDGNLEQYYYQMNMEFNPDE